MLLYAITDRSLLGESESERPAKLVGLAAKWARNGIDFIQIREKDLSAEDLGPLVSALVRAVRGTGGATRVLLNAGPAIAASPAHGSGADGIHLRGGLGAEALRETILNVRQSLGAAAPVSVSCHSIADIQAARAAGASLALFGPVFEKPLAGAESLPGRGLASLAEACRAASQPAAQPALPIFALGGVTFQNAANCLAAGAAGIAGIRLFL